MSQKNSKKLNNSQISKNVELQKKSATKKNAPINNIHSDVSITLLKDCGLLCVNEISEILGVDRKTVALLFKTNQIGYVVISKRKKVLKKDLMTYIMSRRIPPR